MGYDDICNLVRYCGADLRNAIFGLLVVDHDGTSEGVLFLCFR